MSARFSIIPSRAVFDDRLPPAALRVLSALGVYGDRSGWCRPSLSTIGEKLNCTKQAIAKHIKLLAETGYLEVAPRYRKDGGRSSNLYRILFDVGEPDADTLVDDPFDDEEVDAPSTDESPPPVNHRSSRPPSTPEVDGILERPNSLERPNRTKEEYTPARKRADGPVAKPADVNSRTWFDFLALRKAKRAPLTETALSGIAREAAKAGITLDEALRACCERGWQGFKAEWVSNGTQAAPANGGGQVPTISSGDW